MTGRPARLLALASPLLVCVFLPAPGLAQDYPPYPNPYGGATVLHGKHRDYLAAAGPGFGPFWGPWGYGPTVAPGWSYPGLYGGPFVGYPGYAFYGPRAGSSWSNGLSLYGPPVPTYGPIPGVFGNNDLRKLWEQVPSPGIPFGWVGIYAASPRPKFPTVGVWPTSERVGTVTPLHNNFDDTNLPSGEMPKPLTPKQPLPQLPPPATVPPAPPAPDGSLVLSVKVPQPHAEVFVDGVKTNQTGTDRVFDSPPLEGGKEFRYEVTARWMERGALREEKRTVTGTAGEVVRVDFTRPGPITGR
jgi:uncharacterized protein (TIGR03000 family)